MALQALYLVDTCHFPVEDALKSSFPEGLARSVREFAGHLVQGVEDRKPEIDAMLTKYAQNWDLNRMAIIDRNILRLSTYELIHDMDTPVSVIIDEAIEIAKAYSTEDSGKFVNGILDKIKGERKTP